MCYFVSQYTQPFCIFLFHLFYFISYQLNFHIAEKKFEITCGIPNTVYLDTVFDGNFCSYICVLFYNMWHLA